jgi:RHS repeat-associated protein
VPQRCVWSLHRFGGDNLGSVSKTVDAASGTVTKQRYYPYGGIRGTAGSAPTDKGWIGQRKDDSTGLQYLNARYYDPTIGRFLATDPLADLSTVGTLDAYSYGRANPVTLSDPSGLYTCTTAACVFGGSSFFSPSPNAGGPGGGSTGGGGGAGGSSAGTGGDSVADSIAEADAKWHEVDSIKDLLGPNVHAWINDGLLAKRRKSRGEIHGDFWESACVPAYGLCWGEFSESYSDEYEVEANLTALPFGYSEEDLTRTYIVKGVLTEKHVYSSPGYFDPLTGGYDRLSDLDDLLNTDVLGPSHTIERSFEITHYRDANVVAHGQLVPAIVSSDGALTWSIK